MTSTKTNTTDSNINNNKRSPDSDDELLNINTKDEELENRLYISTCYYVFMFVVIGLPIWFLTTTTYRATLPFDEIDEITYNKNLEFLIKIELINFNKQTSISDLEKQLLKEIKNGNIHFFIRFKIINSNYFFAFRN